MQGVQLFRKKPGEMFLFGNTYLFIILFVGILIPFLGAAVVARCQYRAGGLLPDGRQAPSDGPGLGRAGRRPLGQGLHL